MAEVLERLRGALADRYAIEREVGRGGMATVFRAQASTIFASCSSLRRMKPLLSSSRSQPMLLYLPGPSLLQLKFFGAQGIRSRA